MGVIYDVIGSYVVRFYDFFNFTLWYKSMNWAILLSAIMTIETGGHPDPLNALGDNKKSVGCMQIQMAVIQDVNRVYKTNYTAIDRRFKKSSFEICKLYLQHWGKRYEKLTGQKATYEILARMWNGGPNAWKKTGKAKSNLDKYWKKINQEL